MTSIDELFEAQVARTPDAPALEFGASRLSYRELDRRADGIARRLRALGVGPDVPVALFLERSLDMVVGMLGVLKAGGAYVPLDPALPRKRLAYMVADAEPLVLLTQARLQAELPPRRARVVVIDPAAPPAEPPAHAEVPGPARGPQDLAYVIYTSGSTGEPKGVEIEHASVLNMLGSMRRRPGLAATDTMLAITTLAFDIAVLEIFLPLTCGARVVIAGSDIVGDGAALAGLIERSGVSVLQATPATLRMLLDADWTGAPGLKVLCGGEAWTADLAAELLPRCGSLWNMYGPTETTVWSAVARVETGRPIVIGPPIARTRLYVLGGARQLVPVGVPGELYIGGVGLARGYLRRPELTRERFVADPFSSKPGARMYRTGDQVRRLPDGSLEFLGRLDHQVKIRGHRIELGEIEAALARHPGIERCVVVAREDTQGDHRLVAYLIPAAGATVPAGDLRALLGETLPSYMIPAAFVALAAFPLTPNGKLDRKALPAPEVAGAAPEPDAAARAPGTQTELALARIWCDMLGLKQVDVRDNFFDLGGHSLLAVRVIGEINKALNARLHVPAFFQNPTIEGLAAVLARKPHDRPEPQVLPLQTGVHGLPLYLMSARPDEFRIARLLGKDRAVFAIDAPMPVEWHRAMAASDPAGLPTIEQLGALYGDVLRAHAGSSPCVVVGYSFFGKVAFEAARALQRAGGQVAFVMLVDARTFTWGGTIRGPARQSLQWIWRAVAPSTANDTRYIDRLSSTLRNSLRLLGWLLAQTPQIVRNRLPPGDELAPGARPTGFLDKEGVPIDQSVIDRLVYLAGRSWQPRSLDAAGVLFRARFPGEQMLPGYDFTNGWGGLFTRGLEIVQATGDHHSMLRAENTAILARQINDVLDRYETARDAGPVVAPADTKAERAPRHRAPDHALPLAEQTMAHRTMS
jgi:amino acid adenylation domain-containing protein